jgi:hypothetical protein
MGFLPGTTVRLAWSVGSTVINATTTLLPVPEQVGEITYFHEFNMALALNAAGLGEPTNAPVTLRQLVRAAVRRYGDITEDGARALDLADVVIRCFGPRGEVAPGYQISVLTRAVDAAARSLAASGQAELCDGMVIVEERLGRSGRQADAALISRYVDAMQRRIRRDALRHWVGPSVVNLPDSQQLSLEKDESWASVAGSEGLPPDLEDGQTWRRGHLRGTRIAPGVIAELERAQRTVEALGGDANDAERLENAVRSPIEAHYSDASPKESAGD